MTRDVGEQILLSALRLSPKQVDELYDQIDPSDQGSLLTELSPEALAQFIDRLSPEKVASAMEHLSLPSSLDFSASDPSDLARVFGHLALETRQSMLKTLPATLAREVTQMMSYPEETAGALMEVKLPLFHTDDRVGHVTETIRALGERLLTSIFVVDVDGHLKGRVHMQDLLLAGAEAKLREILKPTVFVSEMAPKDEIVEIVEKNRVPSVPVVNADQVVLGIIRNDQLVSIVHQDGLDDLQKMVGVSGNEKALSAPFFSVKKRLPWLSVNLVTTFVAAAVVGVFEDTIAKVTALAVLLPVVAGQSGNTGAQAQAVTMRGLALREIRLRHKWRVLAKEGMVGLVNGAAIGGLCALAVWFWSGSLALGLVIGAAMILAMIAACLSGAAVPMILTAIGQDPATSSSIILTTITDIVGFISFLGLASIFASYLV